jgi:hypothetical protein
MPLAGLGGAVGFPINSFSQEMNVLLPCWAINRCL